MDTLSDVLRVLRLSGSYFYIVEGGDRWCVATAPARELRPRVLPEAEHLVPYHILSEGTCWGGLPGGPRVRMQPGDVLLFPRGDEHVMSSHEHDGVGTDRMRQAPAPYPEMVRVGDGERDSVLMCGFLGCDATPFNPLLSSLPPMLHMPRVGDGWLSTLPSQVLREWSNPRSGSATVLTRLAEVMFIEVLREYMATVDAGHGGWLAALKDPVAGAALACLHERPADDWTIAALAKQVGASRSVVAERFAAVVGLPPMQYLAKWRVQLAADLLRGSTLKVAAIGARVGYESEAAFSRAFKRETGESPAAWRAGRLAQQ
jgi:AraC-like DNA-binding protein